MKDRNRYTTKCSTMVAARKIMFLTALWPIGSDEARNALLVEVMAAYVEADEESFEMEKIN